MSFYRQPACFNRLSTQRLAMLMSRRPITARAPSVAPRLARRPPATPPRRAPNMASAAPHATAIHRSWSYVASVAPSPGLSHTLLLLLGTVKFSDPSDIHVSFRWRQSWCESDHSRPGTALHKACPRERGDF